MQFYTSVIAITMFVKWGNHSHPAAGMLHVAPRKCAQLAGNHSAKRACLRGLSANRLPVDFLRSVNIRPPIFPVVSHGPFAPNGLVLRRSLPFLCSILHFPATPKRSLECLTPIMHSPSPHAVNVTGYRVCAPNLLLFGHIPRVIIPHGVKIAIQKLSRTDFPCFPPPTSPCNLGPSPCLKTFP